MRKESEAWQPHFLSLAAGLVFLLSLFFYLAYVNPNYDGSYFSGASSLVRETIIPCGLAGALIIVFCSEYLTKGYLRDGLSIGGLLLQTAFICIALTDYFKDQSSLSEQAITVREVALILMMVLTLLPLLLAFIRFGRPSFFGAEDPWRELPLDMLLVSLSCLFASVVLLIRMKDEITNATAALLAAERTISSQAGVPLYAEIFAYIVLAFQAGVILYCLYLFQANKRDPSRYCHIFSYLGLIGAFLPFVALYGVFAYYSTKTSGASSSYYGTSYKMMYYAVMMSVPQIVTSLASAVYFFYRDRLLSGN
jgi:hypothetical protein